MSVSESYYTAIPQLARQFASTRWSLVAAAGQRDSPEAEAALAPLCRLSWYPLYAYARRRLPDAEQAQDLTQEFFARLLKSRIWQTFFQPADSASFSRNSAPSQARA